MLWVFIFFTPLIENIFIKSNFLLYFSFKIVYHYCNLMPETERPHLSPPKRGINWSLGFGFLFCEKTGIE